MLLGGAPILQQDDATELLQEEDSDRSTTPAEASDIVKGLFQLLVEETVHNDLCETAKGPIPINGTPVVGSTSRATVADSPMVTNMDDSVDDDGAGDDGINNIGGTRGVWYKVLGSRFHMSSRNNI